MKRRALAAILAIAAGCGPADPWALPTDATGIPWPDICRHDLAAETAEIPVVRLPRSLLTATTPNVSAGYTINGRTVLNSIQIADDLGGWRYADTLHHERCHAVCNRTRDASCTGHFAPKP